MTEAKIALFRGKTAHGGPPIPSKRPSARFQPETREKRRPVRSVVASINIDEFSHGLLKLCTNDIGRRHWRASLKKAAAQAAPIYHTLYPQ